MVCVSCPGNSHQTHTGAFGLSFASAASYCFILKNKMRACFKFLDRAENGVINGRDFDDQKATADTRARNNAMWKQVR